MLPLGSLTFLWIYAWRRGLNFDYDTTHWRWDNDTCGRLYSLGMEFGLFLFLFEPFSRSNTWDSAMDIARLVGSSDDTKTLAI